MSFKIKRQVFAHSFLNPPSQELSCDINLIVSNGKGKFNLVKEATGIQTRYLLTVADPSVLRIASLGQGVVNRATDNLILAIDLTLKNTCLSVFQGDLPSAEINHSSKSKVTVEETPKGKQITISQTLAMSSAVHISLGISEEVNEEAVIALLSKVVRVNRFELKQPSTNEANLSKALDEYKNAMFAFDRLRVFRYLFNTMEFSANWTGTNYKRDNLDSEITSVIKVHQSTVKSWRELYNRTKHADRTAEHIQILKQGVESLPSILPQIREAAKQLVINRLERI